MTAKEYIENSLSELKAGISSPARFESKDNLADFIFKAIMSKKFRKLSVSPEYQSYVREVIEKSIVNDEPIKFVFPFGAYKLWRLEETPEADWAELFTLMYYAKWLKPIVEAYKPGVWFDFSSDAVIVERMDNIPKSQTEAYEKSFNTIIDFLKKYLPENLKFTLTPVASRYTPEEFEEDLKEKVVLMQEKLGGLPVLDEKHKRMVELNVKLKPGQDKDPLWREQVELIHQSYYTVSKRRSYNKADDKIVAFTLKTADGRCVPIGTTKTSVAKFWCGVGVLKKIKDGFIEYILSPSQLKSSVFNKENILIDGLGLKNFKTIRIID